MIKKSSIQIQIIKFIVDSIDNKKTNVAVIKLNSGYNVDWSDE